ncbi:MAG: MFS transporter [Actinomycetes bacterium]|jgi:MFS family permease
MRAYFELLKIRGAQVLLISAFPARLAYSMIGLGTYFKVQHATHSISAAGLAVGLEGMSSALTAGVRGSIMDRWGLKWPLRTFVPAYAALIIIFNLGQSRNELILVAFILGFTAPPINLSVRPMWKITVPPDMIRTAYAMDTSVMTSVGVFGPVLVTTLALSSHPASALNACAGFMLFGGGMMALLPATKAWVPEKKVKGELPIWKVPAIRLLMLEGVFIGFGWGAFYIGVPAFATLQNVSHRTGLILAVMSAFTVIGGLLAGLISSKTSSLQAFRRLYLAWFIFSLPLAFTFPDWRLMLVVAFIGLVNGGLHVFYWEITEAVRPRGSAVAALGWLWTVEGTCAALGQAAGGFISQNYSPRWCLGATTIAISIGLVVINLGKGRLKAADRIPTKESDTEALGDVVSSEN